MSNEVHVKLPGKETIEKLDRMAKDGTNEDVRFLAEVAAGFGRSIISIAEALGPVRFIDDDDSAASN